MLWFANIQKTLVKLTINSGIFTTSYLMAKIANNRLFITLKIKTVELKNYIEVKNTQYEV